jgi:OPA family glycerol-3-phosphate transporter-like MFS transporter
MLKFFRPAPHVERLPADHIDPVYKRLRWQIFLGIFIGYAGYYLVRKNFTLAMPFLIDQEGYSRGALGVVLSAVSLAYGLSKFLMGNVSDRSNPRYFMTAGLLLSAGIMFVFGLVPWATSGIAIMFALMFLNGWVQGMGWPPCGRTMVHWWSKKERGRTVAFWNVSHNVGGGLIGPIFILGMAWFAGDWHSAFYLPAAFATVIAVFCFLTIRDTPQSVGLPPVEEYKQDRAVNYEESHEKEFTARQIFMEHVFNNKFLWFLCLANVFVYLVRYGVLNWAPTYLSEAKNMNVTETSWAYFLYEWSGIPGTILCGWISDRVFKGRRAPAGILYMALVTIAVLVYWLNPPGYPVVDMAALSMIGFLIYGPVMLIGLHALEMVPKKAAGTAAGFTGLFGYIGGAVAASALLGFLVDVSGWNGGFILLVASCLLAMFFIALTIGHRHQAPAGSQPQPDQPEAAP